MGLSESPAQVRPPGLAGAPGAALREEPTPARPARDRPGQCRRPVAPPGQAGQNWAGGPHPLGICVACVVSTADRESQPVPRGSPSGLGGACSSHCRWRPLSQAPARSSKVARGRGYSGSLEGTTAQEAGGWQRHPQRRSPTGQPCPCPSWGTGFLLGCKASWPYKAVCGHLSELQSPHPAPAMGTRAQPGPQGRGGGSGLLEPGAARVCRGAPIPPLFSQGCPYWGTEQGG